VLESSTHFRFRNSRCAVTLSMLALAPCRTRDDSRGMRSLRPRGAPHDRQQLVFLLKDAMRHCLTGYATRCGCLPPSLGRRREHGGAPPWTSHLRVSDSLAAATALRNQLLRHPGIDFRYFAALASGPLGCYADAASKKPPTCRVAVVSANHYAMRLT